MPKLTKKKPTTEVIELDAEDKSSKASMSNRELVDISGLDKDAKAGDARDTDDGGAMVSMEETKEARTNLKHFENIVEDVDKHMLATAVTDLVTKIERDKEARSKRDKLYEEGLRRTGMGDDAPGGAAFSGATKVVHPMLIEACVDFSARAMKEIFPPSGPVKSKILGPQDKEKLAKAERKAAYMNWQATEQMPEFRGELEQLTTQLPLGGGQYLKITYNKQRKRPRLEFVPIDDVLLPFAATNFYTAERKTHVQYITQMEYDRRVKAGMYIDVELPTAPMPDFTKASLANDKIEGRKSNSYNDDGLRTVFEIYTWLEIEDQLCPYILTIDKATEKALALYRNWDEDDENCDELQWMVEFGFVPWRGAYPIGLTHMIGGLSGAATGALRALLDSAHIQNVPTMLKLKGGPSGQTITMQPTEVVEIEGGVMVDDIRKLAMPIPFNPPSPTLFQLLGFCVEAGKGVVQTSFEKLSDQNANQPVGTTMALIEQGMVVFSSIHSRLHSSMGRVFKILARINSAYLTPEDVKAQGSGLEIDPEDFDDPMDVVPVSDPQIFSETQRFAQVQALLQRSTAVPGMYDQRKVEEMFLRAMKVPDDLLMPKPGEDDIDPVSENVAATMRQPVYVMPSQDHLGHLQVHMAFLQSPLFGQNPAIVKTYLYPMVTHLRDHLLNYYMQETHKGVRLAEKKGKIKDDSTEEQVAIILRAQGFIEQQFQGFAEALAQLDEQAQQYAPPPPPVPQDMSLQVAKLNAEQRAQGEAQRLQANQQSEGQRLQWEQQKLQASQQTEAMRLQGAQQAAQQKGQQDAAMAQFQAQQKSQQEAQRAQAAFEMEQFSQQQESARKVQELETRERMNTADNETAMTIVASEIATGERTNLSTGTGINPSP